MGNARTILGSRSENLRKKFAVCTGYFVSATGPSRRRVQGICEDCEEEEKDKACMEIERRRRRRRKLR
jgi:ribosomal silencing factor RsfS